ncbi:MAG: amidohydrolase family protein [Propionibacteriaceae bacterium]
MSVTSDLADVPVVDNHCHSVIRDQSHQGVESWRGWFTESPDAHTRAFDVTSTVFYARLITELAKFHQVPATEEAVLAARAGLSPETLTARMLTAANLEALVVDTGLPDPNVSLSVPELATAAGSRSASLLRLELTFQRLVASSSTYDELVEAVRDELQDARGQGWAGWKTVVAYRTGLAIRRWDRYDARMAFGAARAEVDRTGAVRLGYKPLLDELLHLAFTIAAAEELPVQAHVGYGDPDADLRLANPLLLRDVFEQRAYRGMPLVLLHSCWPFVREGAYLASVYGNAWLDLSYAIPFLSRGELRQLTRAALGAAPASRLMYSSDGAHAPELHWMGAHEGRRQIGGTLDELVADGDLTPDQARHVGERVLRDNALGLYGIGPRSGAQGADG